MKQQKKYPSCLLYFFGSVTPFSTLALKWAPVNTQPLVSDVQNLAPKGISRPHFVQ